MSYDPAYLYGGSGTQQHQQQQQKQQQHQQHTQSAQRDQRTPSDSIRDSPRSLPSTTNTSSSRPSQQSLLSLPPVSPLSLHQRHHQPLASPSGSMLVQPFSHALGMPSQQSQGTASYVDQQPVMTWQSYSEAQSSASNETLRPPPPLQSTRQNSNLSISLPPQHLHPPLLISPPGSMSYSSATVTPPVSGYPPAFYSSGTSPFPSPSYATHQSQITPPISDYFTSQPPPSISPSAMAHRSGHIGPSSPNGKRYGGGGDSSRSASINSGKAEPSSGNKSGAKTSRQQFTACGACRHRRVKCDLKDRQEAAEKQAGSAAKRSGKKIRVSCSNCLERGTNCVDEFAPIKAAKQLRRGKRISEIETLYGRLGQDGVDASDETGSQTKDDDFVIPELGPTFWQSHWLKDFLRHRPIFDPQEITSGPLLNRVLYAWAISLGYDENGRQISDDLLTPLESSIDDSVELSRQNRTENLKLVLEIILKQVDRGGVLRRPQWDNARALLLLVPLVSAFLPSIELHSLRTAAMTQIHSLSLARLNSQEPPQNLSSELATFFYAFAEESLTSSLNGLPIYLDFSLMDKLCAIPGIKLGNSMDYIKSRGLTALNMTTAACRLMHRIVTVPDEIMSNEVYNRITILLDQAWQETEILGYDQTSSRELNLAYKLDVLLVYQSLYAGMKVQLGRIMANTSPDYQRLRGLLDTTRSKCTTLSKVLVDHLRGSPKVLDTGSIVHEDAVYYAARWLMRSGSPDEDVNVCMSVLSSSSWCLSRAWSRVTELRDLLSQRNVPMLSGWSISPPISAASTASPLYPPAMIMSSSGPVIKNEPDVQTVAYPQAYGYEFYTQ
ncbi:hypothetical protein BD324DRAFT_466027 [Kockovaella imperatae]|uniref:Zn(2)-C6 fungal-type domain-containing protein n=1 Tax=Kockovaella imperatae TaxID=4999 RepID=A0A1Y1UGX0_9TREE|nr:hypothetical protein BD324DRAFT_466027 [Kockovaella imperatae]ORX36756.1 hypothetical protein BD324DRAFT_466027 [Kockovaella imperatae]